MSRDEPIREQMVEAILEATLEVVFDRLFQ
jgi:hypothetical protein